MSEVFREIQRQALGTNYKHMAGSSTLVVKSSTGILERVVINVSRASTALVVYDNSEASAPIIAQINNPGSPTNNFASIPYHLKFNTGLTVVTPTGWDVTVIYD